MRPLVEKPISWLMVLLFGLLAPVASNAADAPAPSVELEDPARPLVVVRALGRVDPAQLRLACRSVLERYPLRCEVGEARRLLDHAEAWDPERGQLDARAILDDLFRSRSDAALVELNVTAVDAFEDGKPYVFGLANLTDRVGLVSLARVAFDQTSPWQAERRLQKLVLHEVGHALGLPHHLDDDCVMRQDATPESLDTAPDGPCERCHNLVTERAAALSRPGQIALDHVRGHLARGEAHDARTHLVEALWKVPLDSLLLNRFSLAFIEAGHWNEAISLLDLALKSDPAFAEAHVNRGLALQMRGREGDLHEAITHFSRAIELRPEWGSVEAHLDTLRGQRARAQGPR